MNDETIAALQLVDSRRRSFLSKLLAGGAALVALPAMSTVVLGQEETENAAGKGGGKGKGEAGGKGQPGGRMDPKQMAMDMLIKFDKDGDQALNQEELVAALTDLAKQRAAQGGAQGEGKGKGGTQGEGKGKGGGQGEGKGKGGGQGEGKGKGKGAQ